MLLEVVGGGRSRPSRQHDERRQALAVLLVVDADHGGLGDIGMGRQHLLHLDRVDVLAAGDDHLVVAADHEKPPGLIQAADIAGRHEAVVEVFAPRRRCNRRTAAGVAHEDLADLAGRHLGEVVVEDADLGAHRRVCPPCPARRAGRSGVAVAIMPASVAL